VKQRLVLAPFLDFDIIQAGAARAVAIFDPPGLVFKPDSAMHAGNPRVGRQVKTKRELVLCPAKGKVPLGDLGSLVFVV
jgi:hypothetical protein